MRNSKYQKEPPPPVDIKPNVNELNHMMQRGGPPVGPPSVPPSGLPSGPPSGHPSGPPSGPPGGPPTGPPLQPPPMQPPPNMMGRIPPGQG